VDKDSKILDPPINPTPRPCFRVTWRSVPWVTWEAVTGVEWTPVEGYDDTRWLTGLWSTHTKVEGVVLKAVWHWGSNSSIVNDPLGEPGTTPFYVVLPSAWESVGDDRRWALETDSLSRGTLRGEPGYGGSFTGNSDSYIRRKEGFGNGASLSMCRASVKGTWMGSPILRTTRDM